MGSIPGGEKVIQIPGAPAPIGPYSQAILVKDTLYVSGQIPLNPKTGELVDSTIEESTHQVMKVEHIVKCSIFLKDLNNFAKVNAIYAEYFRSLPPARETVQVSKLPMDVDIEISCIAVND